MNNSLSYWPALIAGASTLLGVWFATKWSKDRERAFDARQLAKAFKGEITAIVHILELRNYQAGLRRYAAQCRSEQIVHVYSVSAKQEYRAIYSTNSGKIGCLPGSLPEQVAIFYTFAASLMEDFTASGEIRDGDKPIAILGTPDQAAARYEQIANYIDDLIGKAKAVIAEIENQYPNTLKAE